MTEKQQDPGSSLNLDWVQDQDRVQETGSLVSSTPEVVKDEKAKKRFANIDRPAVSQT